MSQPVFTQLDPLAIRDGVLDIGHGNWRAGGDLGALTNPKWMAVVDIDGARIRGTVPSMPSVGVGVIYPGELGYEERLFLDLRPGYSDGKAHTVTVRIYVAQFYEGSGDHPDDAWEWGHTDTATQTVPAKLEKTFTLGAAPPPPVSDFVRLREHAKTDLEAALRLVDNPRSSAPRPYWAQKLLTSSPADLKKAAAALAKVWP